MDMYGVTKKLEKLGISSPTSIPINYEPRKYWYSPIHRIVKNLIVERRLSVLLVGEGNFSFALALAAVRGSWDGITATCLTDPFQHQPAATYIPEFNDPLAAHASYWTSLKLLSVGHCITNSIILDDGETLVGLGSILRSISNILKVEIPPQHSIKGGVDCRFLPDDLMPHGIVWFQCPWTPQNREDLGELLATFLMKSKSEYVLIGIANKFPYTLSYKLEYLFQKDLTQHGNVPIECGDYTYLGADDNFIETILKHGYKHEGCHPNRDIHTTIIKDHITLIFQRRHF